MVDPIFWDKICLVVDLLVAYLLKSYMAIKGNDYLAISDKAIRLQTGDTAILIMDGGDYYVSLQTCA